MIILKMTREIITVFLIFMNLVQSPVHFSQNGVHVTHGDRVARISDFLERDDFHLQSPGRGFDEIDLRDVEEFVERRRGNGQVDGKFIHQPGSGFTAFHHIAENFRNQLQRLGGIFQPVDLGAVAEQFGQNSQIGRASCRERV